MEVEEEHESEDDESEEADDTEEQPTQGLKVLSLLSMEIRPWTHMMEVPQLHGFRSAANRLLEAYNMLLKV